MRKVKILATLFTLSTFILTMTLKILTYLLAHFYCLLKITSKKAKKILLFQYGKGQTVSIITKSFRNTEDPSPIFGVYLKRISLKPLKTAKSWVHPLFTMNRTTKTKISNFTIPFINRIILKRKRKERKVYSFG